MGLYIAYLCFVVSTIIVLLQQVQSANEEAREYCEWESFNASCKRNEVVLMQSAKYGRMRLGRCVTKNYGHIGCGTDVIPFMDSQCSGRQNCVLSVIGLHNKRSCPKDFKSYLQADYECVPVNFPTTSGCHRPLLVNASRQTGYLASSVARSTRVGSWHCPWTITVDSYQRINLTLLDFSDQAVSDVHGYSQSSTSCELVYAYVVEGTDPKRNISICGGRKKISHAYISISNSIQIYFVSQPGPASEQPNYLFSYEGVGCPPLVPPALAYVRIGEDHAVVHCNETEEAWFLACEGSSWVGHVGNCTQYLAEVVDWTVSDMFTGVSSFPFGLLIVVALGVAIGVAIGLVMLVSVLAYMKRRRGRKIRSRSNYLLKSMAQENAENLCKANGESVADCSPMLLKRQNSLPLHRSMQPLSGSGDYGCTTWTMKRPLPVPKVPSEHNILSGRDRDSYRGQDASTHHLPSQHSFLRAASVPRTIMSPCQLPEGGGQADSPCTSPRSEYIVRTCDESPYYFKFDNPLRGHFDGTSSFHGERKDEEGEGPTQPDLLPGCLDCQERAHTQHSAV